MTDARPEIYAFIAGTHTIPARFLVEGREGLITVPIPSYLIRHPQGDLIFDTGLARRSHLDQEAYVGPGAPKGMEFHFSAEQEVPAQLKATFDIDEVPLVANSHLHYDHCGGNELFPDSTVIMQRREFAASVTAPSQTVSDLRSHFEIDGQRMLLVDGEYDVFGDGTVVLMPTYGHTPGHQSLKVGTIDGDFLLAADSCYLQETLEDFALPGVINDPDRVIGVLKDYRQMVEGGVTIVFGHDPEFWRTVSLAPEPLRVRAR